MNNELAIECYTLELQDYNQQEIAQKLNIGQATVSRQINKIKKSRDFQMGVITINEFFGCFKKCEQYWQQSNHELRLLIDEVQKIKVEDDMDGKDGTHIHKSKYEKRMERIELISKLIEKQDKNMEKILNLANQGEVILALKAARGILEQHAPGKSFILKKVENVQ